MLFFNLFITLLAINFATTLDCDRYGRRCNYDNSHDLRITYSDRDNFKDVGGRGRVDITGFVDRSNQVSWFKRSDEKTELKKKDQVKRAFNFHNSKLDRTNQNDYSGAYVGPSSRYQGNGGFNFHNSYLDRTDQNAYGRKKRAFNFHNSYLDRTNQNDYSGRYYYKRGFNYYNSVVNGNLVNPQPAVKPVIKPVTATPAPQVKVLDVKPVPVAPTPQVKVLDVKPVTVAPTPRVKNRQVKAVTSPQGEYVCSIINGQSSCRPLSTREQSLLDKPSNPSNIPVPVISKTDSRDNIIQNSPSYLKGTKDCDSNGQRCNIYV